MATTDQPLAGDRKTTPASTKRWLQAALVLWGLLAVAASVKMIVDPRTHTVYTTFAGAAHDWWSGRSLYTGREYFYSPAFAAAMSPFAILPDWLGGAAWAWVSCGLLVYALREFYRTILPRSWPAAAEGQFLLLALIGTVCCIWSGQSNAILIAMVLLAAVEVARRRWWRAAL
jgi:alpha-1,2-mannosyltransferase